MRVFRSKKNKEKEVIEETKAVEKTVETAKSVESTTPTEEKKTTTRNTKKAQKSVCRVIVATPSYFVIDKNGETITINKKNTYHKGEEIYY